jgi:YD repeat-containing protein
MKNKNNTVSVTDANGNTVTYGYDDQNRRISTTNVAGETSTTTFDDAGNGIGAERRDCRPQTTDYRL